MFWRRDWRYFLLSPSSKTASEWTPLQCVQWELNPKSHDFPVFCPCICCWTALPYSQCVGLTASLFHDPILRLLQSAAGNRQTLRRRKEGTGVPTGIWWARTLKLDCFVYIAEQEVTTAQAACLPSRDRWRLGITALWSFVKKRWERSSVACEWHCPLGWRRCGDKDGVTENMSKLELYSVCFFFNCYKCDNINTCFKGQRSTWWPGYILPRVPKNCACLATCRQSAYSNG